MKNTALVMVVLAGLAATAVAGEEPSAKAPKNPIDPPPPSPSLYQWFIGGTVGYLDEYDTEFYSGHIGVDMPYQLGGWDTAVYLEVGWFEQDYLLPTFTFGSFALGGPTELEVIPITLNYKLERELSGALRAYLGAGAGVALVDVTMSGASDDDTTFYGQVFGGLLYQASEAFEVYGGARWIYLDEIDLLGIDSFLDTGDDFMIEGGIRFNF